MKIKFLLAAGLGLLVLAACVQPKKYPVEPVITFKGLSRSVLKQGQGPIDSTFVTITFTDGDGDLGDKQGIDAYFIDKRDNNIKGSFRIPFIPEEGVGNGISGEITFRLNTTCCIFPNMEEPPCTPSTKYPTDTLRYIIYIKDRAGHESNRVETSDIVLLCN